MSKIKFTDTDPQAEAELKATELSKTEKKQLLKKGFQQAVLVQGNNFFRLFNQPVGGKYRWCAIAKFFYNTITKDYLLLTDEQANAINNLSKCLYTDLDTKPLMSTKTNKEGLNLRPKMRLVVQGCKFEVTKAHNGTKIDFNDPTIIMLPYSDYKTDMVGNALEALRIATDFSNKLKYPNMFNVMDANGNLLDGESVNFEVCGEKERTTYKVSPDNPVRIPEAVLELAVKFEDALNYATNEEVERYINGELAKYSINAWQVAKNTPKQTVFKI